MLHSLRPGAPISDSIVGRAVGRALDRAGIDAPSRGANLLRHSLATGLLAPWRWSEPDSRSARPLVRGHDSHLCRGRRRSPARGGYALAGGETVTAPVMTAVEVHIAMRHGLGYRSPTQERALRAFARHLDSANHSGPISLESTLEWATSSTSTDPCNPARRLATVRGFLRHLSALDGATEVPASGLLGATGARKPPQVYTDDEIAALLNTAAGLDPVGGLRPRCYVTLFGLLACTGLRISEVLTLSCADVDLDAGVIMVRAGKRGLTRLIPLHPSAMAPSPRLPDGNRRLLPHRGQRADQLQHRPPRLPLGSTALGLGCQRAHPRPTGA